MPFRNIVSHPFDVRPGKVLDNRYVVESEIGEGSFGKVYKVMKQGHPLPLTLKVLKLWMVPPIERETVLARFDQEYQTSLIDSEYLVHAIDKGEISGNPYIVTEYCSGGNLLEAACARSVDLCQAAAEVLMGLRVLHANGKVHRDLKPENVLIKDDGCAALSDFGICGDCNRRITEKGLHGIDSHNLGTYAYMAPERINVRDDDATVLPVTDIYAFGVMMYQLLTGRLPFGPLESINQVTPYVLRALKGEWDRDPIARDPQLRAWLPLLEGCIEPDYRKRISSAKKALALVPNIKFTDTKSMNLSMPRPKNGYMLRVMQGEQYGRTYRLDDIARTFRRRVLTVGRNDREIQNFVSILEHNSCHISRQHSTLELTPVGTWLLRDGQWDVSQPSGWKSSRNGTFVGSRRVDSAGVELKVGDIVTIGDVKMRVEGY